MKVQINTVVAVSSIALLRIILLKRKSIKSCNNEFTIIEKGLGEKFRCLSLTGQVTSDGKRNCQS